MALCGHYRALTTTTPIPHVGDDTWGLNIPPPFTRFVRERRMRTQRTCLLIESRRKPSLSSPMWNSLGEIASPVTPAKEQATSQQVRIGGHRGKRCGLPPAPVSPASPQQSVIASSAGLTQETWADCRLLSILRSEHFSSFLFFRYCLGLLLLVAVI